MQTFLPGHGDTPEQVYEASMKILDRARLGKQRVETFQLLRAIDDPNYGWRNHPACQMWIGYRPALIRYYNVSLQEWAARGYVNSKLQPIPETGQKIDYPPWLIDSPLRSTHRVALYIKMPKHVLYRRALTRDEWVQYSNYFTLYGWELHYAQIVQRVCKDLYYWPTKQVEKG